MAVTGTDTDFRKGSLATTTKSNGLIISYYYKETLLLQFSEHINDNSEHMITQKP